MQPSVNNATDGSEAEEGWHCILMCTRADLKHNATFSTFAPSEQTCLFNRLYAIDVPRRAHVAPVNSDKRLELRAPLLLSYSRAYHSTVD